MTGPGLHPAPVAGPKPRPDPTAARGQVLVLFALSLVALIAAAGLAFDIARFQAERRFLQNAADAAALAAAGALIRGAPPSEADEEARATLARNLAVSPNGSAPAPPPTTPVYEPGHAGDPTYLTNGILVSGSEVRVALQSEVGYTFGRIVGLREATVGARARARTVGDLLPIAVRHYVNAPGPRANPPTPCDGDDRYFMDFLATADTACLGSVTDRSLRQAPSPGLPFDPANPNNDPAHHGPIVALVGQGAQAGNGANFRGFVALDIRNFASFTSNVFYNGVTAGTNPNTLKAIEAGWVATGYPGPAFPPATIPPDPNDQVGVLDGNSAGIVVDAMGNRFRPGDEILAAVYSGTVMGIPDFQYSLPGTVQIGTSQDRSNQVSMSVTKNTEFAGQVYTSALADWGDPTNPLTIGTLAPLTFSPDAATPPTTVVWSTFRTSGASVGISTIWILGHSPSPYLTDHYYPVAINVGGVGRDFSSTAGGQVLAVASTGETATGIVTFSTPNRSDTAFGGTVTVSVEGGPATSGALPSGIGPISVSPASFSLPRGTRQDVTITIDTGTLGPGEYPLTVRATGTNADGQPVTRLYPIVLDVATAGTSTSYVDIEGFGVFRITQLTANTVYGYAISGLYPDMNDPALARGGTARLVPWN